MRHLITFCMAAMLCPAASVAQTYRLGEMTADTFEAGGDAQWSFEKYDIANGRYSRFAKYTHSNAANYLDIYQPERVGGERISEIEGVTANGNFTYAANLRMAWCDVEFDAAPQAATANELFCYVCRDEREGFGYEVYGTDTYASVVTFTVPADGYYRLSGTVIREDGDTWNKQLDILPRFRYANSDDQDALASYSTMGQRFTYGSEQGPIDDADGNWSLANGASPRWKSQQPTSFAMTFNAKAGDKLSLEVNVDKMLPYSATGHAWWTRTFYRDLQVEAIDEETALANDNYVDTQADDKTAELLDLIDEYESTAGDFVIGDGYGEYPRAAYDAFFEVSGAIVAGIDEGSINNMNVTHYLQQLEEAWKQLLAAQVLQEYDVEGNYRLFSLQEDGEVAYDAALMGENDDQPWGFYYYRVGSGEYSRFENHDTGSKYGSSEVSAWYKGTGDWLYISDSGDMHPTTDYSPAIVFTAPADGVYRVEATVFRPNPNEKVENPLWLRSRYMDANTATCAKENCMFAAEYGSVAGDGQGGKAPVSLNYFVNMHQGDKITFEEDCYTTGRNSSAGSRFTQLAVCSKLNSETAYDVAYAKASGMDFYNPYGAGDMTSLAAAYAAACAAARAVGDSIKDEEGFYPTAVYQELAALIATAEQYLQEPDNEAYTQVLIDQLELNLIRQTELLLASRRPYEMVVSGQWAIAVEGTDKYLTQKNSAGSHYYAGFFNYDGIVADAEKNGRSVDEYSWTFTFAQSDEYDGTTITNDNGYLTPDGYIMGGEDGDPAAHTFSMFTQEKGDELFAIQRQSDGAWFTSSFSWKSPYDKVNTSSSPQYIFRLSNATVTAIDKVEQCAPASTRFYSIAGVPLSAPARGLNIVRSTMPDGSVRVSKIFIK